jgi:CDP-2,3-bis-(O-geranylgeranyl)-sn-glycerol synthase
VVFLPAGIANMSPIFANKIPGLRRWNTPMDLGKSFRGKRLLGDNKRIRGLAFGTVLATCTGPLIALIITSFELSMSGILLVAAASGLMGCGALLGDAMESFFKRQRGIKSGESWFPFDQIDYIIGGLLVSYPLVRWPVTTMCYIFVAYFGLHIIASYIGYLLKLKDKPI